MTLCDLYKWEITDGPSFFLTSAQVPITYAGDTYEAAPVRRASLQVQSSQDAKGKVDVQLPISHDLARLWDLAPPTEDVQITIIQVDHDDPGQTAEVLATARVSADRGDGSMFVLELLPLGSSSQKLPRGDFSAKCRWNLYGPGCGLNESTRGVAHSVISRDPLKREIVVQNFATPAAGALEAGYYAGGFVRPMEPDGFGWETVGERRLIYAQPEPTLEDIINNRYHWTLTLAYWSDLLLSCEQIDLYRGCDKSVETCQSFGNLLNFGGFPTVSQINHSPFGDGFTR